MAQDRREWGWHLSLFLKFLACGILLDRTIGVDNDMSFQELNLGPLTRSPGPFLDAGPLCKGPKNSRAGIGVGLGPPHKSCLGHF